MYQNWNDYGGQAYNLSSMSGLALTNAGIFGGNLTEEEKAARAEKREQGWSTFTNILEGTSMVWEEYEKQNAPQPKKKKKKPPPAEESGIMAWLKANPILAGTIGVVLVGSVAMGVVAWNRS
jgi:hypothetical protein